MGRFDDYAERAQPIADKAVRTSEVADRLRDNSNLTNSFSDFELCTYNANQRGVLKTDFAYQNLQKCNQIVIRLGPPFEWSSHVWSAIRKLEDKIERRTMTQKEYEYISRTSPEVLIDEFTEEARAGKAKGHRAA